MKPVHVVWPLGRGFWDMAMLEHVFSHRWRPVCAHTFEHHMKFEDVPADADGAVVVLPARHCDQAGMGAHRLTQLLSRFAWALVLATGDEESVFHAEQIQHPNIKRWQFLPKPGKHDFADRRVINGYPTGVERLRDFPDEATRRPLRWFFSGQVTHTRRWQCVRVLQTMTDGFLNQTPGFTAGLPHDEYYRLMASAQMVPCPSGAVMPDSFRFAEALEAGCIPMADGRSPHDDYPRGYWNYVLGEEPLFPVVDSWDALRSFQPRLELANRLFAWWQGYKRKLAYWMRDDINALRGEQPVFNSTDEKITVLIPTSPIPSHPETTIIDEVVASVRRDLPNSEIIIMMDGVRPAVEHRRAQYEEYKRRLLWKANHEWKNVLCAHFDHPTQQADMTRWVLDNMVKTPYVLFMEHDAVLLTERHINWDAIVATIDAGEANMVRLYWRPQIHPEHLYLMRGSYRSGGTVFERTVQYSQWPNVASAAFYRRILADHFPVGKPAMIETVMYSPVVEYPWDRYKVVIYTPDGDACVWVHRNGRQGDPADW